jgi:hypothetical protein
MSLPFLGRRERDLPTSQASYITTFPSAQPLQLLYWGFATRSPCCLCKVTAPWSLKIKSLQSCGVGLSPREATSRRLYTVYALLS